MASPTLSVVIPVWNEQAILASLCRSWGEVREELMAAGVVGDLELVVVDDGSVDSTPALLRERSERVPWLRVLTHGENRGLGAAVRSGVAAARGDRILYTDADMPFDPRETRRLLAADPEGDRLVAGVRLSRRGEGPRRFVYSLVYNSLIRRALGVGLRDVNFAAKVFPGGVARDLTIVSNGSFVDAELVALLVGVGLTVTEVPLSYQPRTTGVSTLSSGAVIGGMLIDLAKHGRRLRSGVMAARRDRPGSTRRSV